MRHTNTHRPSSVSFKCWLALLALACTVASAGDQRPGSRPRPGLSRGAPERVAPPLGLQELASRPVTGAVPRVDPNEPNDTTGSATPIGCGFVADLTIDPLNDVDFFLLSGPPGALLAIDLDAAELGSGLDTVLGVYDSSGSFLDKADDAAGPYEEITTDSYLLASVPGDGLIYIGVSSYNDQNQDGSGGQTTGPYTIEVLCPDDEEPNGDRPLAGPAECNATKLSYIFPLEDLDYHVVSGPPGARITADIDAWDIGSRLDSILGLYINGQVPPIAVNDDGAAPGEPDPDTADSYAEGTIPGDGVVYAAVTAWPDTNLDGTGGETIGFYALEFICYEPEEEPNDGFAGADSLGCEVSKDASIDPLGDVDYYVMSGIPGLNVALDVDGNEFGSSLDSVLGAFDSGQSLLTSNDDGAAPGESASADSYLELPLPADGQLYAAVTSAPDSDFDGVDGTTTGNYSLLARCFGEASEPNDGFYTAATYPCATTADAFIYPLTDVDYFVLTTTPLATVTIDVDADEIGSGLDSVLGVFDSSFAPIDFSDDDPAPGEGGSNDSYLEVIVPLDGLIYFAVASGPDNDFDGTDGTTIGQYTLDVTCTDPPCPVELGLENVPFGVCDGDNAVTVRLLNPECAIKSVQATLQDAPDWLGGTGCAVPAALDAEGFSCAITDVGGAVELTVESSSGGMIPLSAVDQPVATVTLTGGPGCQDDCATAVGLGLASVTLIDEEDRETDNTLTGSAIEMCPCSEPGDVNCDLAVCNIFDILETIDQSLGLVSETCEADVDCSCAVNIFDAICLVDCALADPSSCLIDACPASGCMTSGCSAPLSPSTAAEIVPAGDGVPLVVRLDETGGTSVSLSLREVPGSIKGLSLALHVPSPWVVTDVSSDGPAAPGFYQDGGTLRIVLVSLDGQPVAHGDGRILTLELESEGTAWSTASPDLHLVGAEAADGDGRPLEVRLVN